MTELHVKIESLNPMRVVWVREVGAHPEQQAWSRLRGHGDRGAFGGSS